ncbi:MAG: FMN-binding protein [Bacillota bacterium]|nr:FMN-binding protein [Bacillota bacterium]
MKKFLKISAIVIAVVVVAGTAMFFYIKSRPVPVINIGTVDMSSIKDGSYTGEYEKSPVKAVVNVSVKDNKITDIKIVEHKCGLGKKAEKITKEIINAQSLGVDTVSGATLSSRVILKAVENALEKGKKL